MIKRIFILTIILILTGCSSNKKVYWCGDHACVNKKEKEDYFKKTMIVEIRSLDKNQIKGKSSIEKITERALMDQKKQIKEEKSLKKQAKFERKRKIQEEKALAKQIKLEKKRKIKEEKALAKKAKFEKKKKIQEEKKVAKKLKSKKKKLIKKNKKTEKIVKLETSNQENKPLLSNFEQIINNITKKNLFRPFPDINDIQN